MSAKVLVADDERDFVELISFNLKQRGYEVLTAYNGLDALSQARKEAPDLIILDVMMPGADGFSVCEILRRESLTGSIPVLMHTALRGEMARLNGVEAGADDYVPKPSGIQELVRRVERLLQLPKGKMAEANPDPEEARRT